MNSCRPVEFALYPQDRYMSDVYTRAQELVQYANHIATVTICVKDMIIASLVQLNVVCTQLHPVQQVLQNLAPETQESFLTVPLLHGQDVSRKPVNNFIKILKL